MKTAVKKRLACGILLCAVVGTIVDLAVSAYLGAVKLTVSEYTVACQTSAPLCVVQLSDLHSRQYGEDNAALIDLTAKQAPDLILMTGDMLNESDTEAEAADLCRLVQALSAVAPVYWSDGNHEKQYMQLTHVDLHNLLTEAGATVLDGTYTDTEIGGQALRIGGYYGYYGAPHMTEKDAAVIEKDVAFFAAFEDTARLKLLLCHIPTPWVDWEYVDVYPVDLVFSGHYHGGQIRIPLIGGLYAPYVGLFPKQTHGVYAGAKGTCILSAGLGSEAGIPRIHNLPELVVVRLQPAQ